jgi:hypothetical protein
MMLALGFVLVDYVHFSVLLILLRVGCVGNRIIFLDGMLRISYSFMAWE